MKQTRTSVGVVKIITPIGHGLSREWNLQSLGKLELEPEPEPELRLCLCLSLETIRTRMRMGMKIILEGENAGSRVENAPPPPSHVTVSSPCSSRSFQVSVFCGYERLVESSPERSTRVLRMPENPVRSCQTHRQAQYYARWKNTQADFLSLILAYRLTSRTSSWLSLCLAQQSLCPQIPPPSTRPSPPLLTRTCF